MPKEEKRNQYVSVRSMFLNGDVRNMKDIEKLFPTSIAKSLGINYGRYIQKLHKPEEFTIQQLIDLSNLLDLDIQLIWDVIIKQTVPSLKYSRKK